MPENCEIIVMVTSSSFRNALKGAVMIFPLSIAVIPWGLLAGSLAVDAGFIGFEAQAVSLFVFAGSVQLVGMALIKSGASVSVLLMTSVFLTSRHLLYSVTLRNKIKHLKFSKRIIVGFLLTDELFAILSKKECKDIEFSYALGAGVSFYLVWQASSLAGILLAQSIPDLNSYGLDFAVVATFISIVIPLIKHWSTLVSVISALLLSVYFTLLDFTGAIVLAGILAMILGYLVSVLLREER